jgi:hypothetical protein
MIIWEIKAVQSAARAKGGEVNVLKLVMTQLELFQVSAPV